MKRIRAGLFLTVLGVALAGSGLAAEQVNPLGPDVHDSAAVGTGVEAPLSGVVGRTDLPTEPVAVTVQPRFGLVTLTTTGKKTTEAAAPVWQWPTPTLTMPAPTVLLGGHAPVWRAVQAACAAGAQDAAPHMDLVGSAGQQTMPAAVLAWHRTSFSDPAKLAKLIASLNARDAGGRSQPIQFYFHTVELGVIDPKGGPEQTAAYKDCFVAVEVKAILCGGGFEAEPVLIENQEVKAVQAKYWLDCGFAEPVKEHFEFTTLKRIKLQLPQRHRNFLGFLQWLNGDWLDIDPDPEVAAVAPVKSLDFASEKEFVAALEAIRLKFKEKRPHLTLVKISPNIRDRLAGQYQGLGAEKE